MPINLDNDQNFDLRLSENVRNHDVINIYCQN